MLETASTHTMIAVSDLGRAEDFYGGTLGLSEQKDSHGTGIRYGSPDGCWFMVYRSPSAGTAKNTCMRFEVEDIDSTVGQLRDRGVVFEEYDLPGLTTVQGTALHESGARGAWFKDPSLTTASRATDLTFRLAERQAEGRAVAGQAAACKAPGQHDLSCPSSPFSFGRGPRTSRPAARPPARDARCSVPRRRL